jgi:type IV pilus assembly protein PilZ
MPPAPASTNPEVFLAEDLRRYSRVPFHAPVTFTAKGSEETSEGECRDLSLGGMFIETTTPRPFGSEVVVHVSVPGEAKPYVLPGVVRWVRGGGMGVQFGLLGARETNMITRFAAGAARKSITSE